MPYPMSSAPPLLGGDMFLMAIWEAMGTLFLHPCPQCILPREGRSSHNRTGSWQLTVVQPSLLAGTRRIVFGRTLSGPARLQSHSRRRSIASNAGMSVSPFGAGSTPLWCHASLQPQFRPSSCTLGLSRHALAAPSVRGKNTSLRCEVHLLRAAFAAAPIPASAAVSAVPPPPEGNPSGVTLPYVRATRAHAPIHVKCPIQDGRTKCGWKWSSCPHITELLQPIHFQDDSSEHMTPMCSRCRDALSASDSSASSSEGPGTLSSTCGVWSAPSRQDGPAGKAPGGAPAAA